MDTDWCLGCDRHTTTDGQAYCSKACMLIDQSSLPRSYPVPSYSRPRFVVPVMSPQRSSSTKHYRELTPHRPRTTEPMYNSPRFEDDELLGSSTVATQCWNGKDRAGILRWACSVHPGLEEETSPIPYPENPSPAVAELQKVLFRPPAFPLTAQNLAPPCVTVAARHVTLSHASFQLEDHTSASQDDSSLQTPATESIVASSIPDTSAHVSKPLFGRLVTKVCSWMVSPTHESRASSQGNPSPPSAEGCLGHSDETQRVTPYCQRSSVADLPSTPIRHHDPYPTDTA